ncbi:MAG: NAD-dependent epimerase/dehydratase family protein [Proteobacteria bacterium]|nr:NAD-dependent epimerase/dehydratase family protein [Pseudomonadota bacterium]MDA0843137.1 NAD-dependent epimerase/dehydratase family protein [Bacteroidota bacterium]
MRVGITGGAGFIGSNLAEHLIKSGHSISVLDNLEGGFMSNLKGLDINFVKADLKNITAVQDFFKSEKIDYCVHLGALGSVPRSIENPRSSFESNATATLNVLEEVKKKAIPFMLSSSSSVYGKNLKLPKEEKDWLSPISPYAASKLAAESMTLAFRESYGIPTMVYRLFNVYGPKQNSDSLYAAVIPKWTLAAFKKEPLIIFGDGEQKRDFTYVGDVVKILSHSIKSRHDVDVPVNLAFGRPVTLNQILAIFQSYFSGIRVEYRETRTGDILHSESNPKNLNELHKNDITITDLNVGLFNYFEWFKHKKLSYKE